jgi:DNA-binding HxlR family transcriptional regulator
MSTAERSILVESRSSASSVWSLWALSEVTSEGPLRFSRLLSDPVEGVSQESLTATPRRLERDGLVRRSITVQVSVRVDYEATALGHELIVKFQPFWIWSMGPFGDGAFALPGRRSGRGKLRA